MEGFNDFQFVEPIDTIVLRNSKGEKVECSVDIGDTVNILPKEKLVLLSNNKRR